MNFIGKIIEKLKANNDSNNRIKAENIIAKINDPSVSELFLDTHEVILIRQYLAEKMGREFCDTPLPESYNGVFLFEKK